MRIEYFLLIKLCGKTSNFFSLKLYSTEHVYQCIKIKQSLANLIALFLLIEFLYVFQILFVMPTVIFISELKRLPASPVNEISEYVIWWSALNMTVLIPLLTHLHNKYVHSKCNS